MGTNWNRHDFSYTDELEADLAYDVAQRLRSAIEERGTATLAVSGGSTPLHFFQDLSEKEVDWSKITITLVDERCVEERSSRSNAGLVRTNLLQNEAASARFIPLFRSELGIEGSLETAIDQIARLGTLLDVVVLGMGSDGHTASFFPDAAELEQLLDPEQRALVMSVHADSAGETRLTLTLPTIASARFLALHITGAEKQATLEKALAPGARLPIRRVIDAAQSTVEIYWAP